MMSHRTLTWEPNSNPTPLRAKRPNAPMGIRSQLHRVPSPSVTPHATKQAADFEHLDLTGIASILSGNC